MKEGVPPKNAPKIKKSKEMEGTVSGGIKLLPHL